MSAMHEVKIKCIAGFLAPSEGQVVLRAAVINDVLPTSAVFPPRA